MDGVHVITIGLDSCNVIAIYRLHYKKTFLAPVDEMVRGRGNCILVGDINLDLLHHDKTATEYFDLFEKNKMTILNCVVNAPFFSEIKLLCKSRIKAEINCVNNLKITKITSISKKFSPLTC